MAGQTPTARAAETEASEIARSALEASRTVVNPVVDLRRYLDPPPDTPYPLEYAFHLIGDVRGRRVLDFGCGSGENIVPLVRRGALATGIDLSPDLLALARVRLGIFGVEAELRECSALDTGLESGSFDVAVCIAILHHLDLGAAKRELARLVRPGGLIVIMEPVRFSWLVKQLRRVFPPRGDVSEGEYPLSREQLRFFAHGLVPVSSRLFRSLFASPLLGAGPKIARVTWSADSWLLRHIPAMRHFSTVHVAAFRMPGETGGARMEGRSSAELARAAQPAECEDHLGSARRPTTAMAAAPAPGACGAPATGPKGT